MHKCTEQKWVIPPNEARLLTQGILGEESFQEEGRLAQEGQRMAKCPNVRDKEWVRGLKGRLFEKQEDSENSTKGCEFILQAKVSTRSQGVKCSFC